MTIKSQKQQPGLAAKGMEKRAGELAT